MIRSGCYSAHVPSHSLSSTPHLPLLSAVGPFLPCLRKLSTLDDADERQEAVHLSQIQHRRVVQSDDAGTALVETAVIVALQPDGTEGGWWIDVR